MNVHQEIYFKIHEREIIIKIQNILSTEILKQIDMYSNSEIALGPTRYDRVVRDFENNVCITQLQWMYTQH